MAALLLSTPALLDPFPRPSGALEPDAPKAGTQEVHRRVREAARQARRLWLRDGERPASGGRTALAGQILREALERYRRPDGYEGHLVEAAWQLEQMGWEAWPVLRELVLEGVPEVEYFLGAAVRLEGVAPQRRLTVLLAAARHPASDVRSRLLELSDEMPGSLRAAVLRELTSQGRPDDSATDRAREEWDEQGS
jgi:hypothetical protein